MTSSDVTALPSASDTFVPLGLKDAGLFFFWRRERTAKTTAWHGVGSSQALLRLDNLESWQTRETSLLGVKGEIRWC
jgi:hypothetical protein